MIDNAMHNVGGIRRKRPGTIRLSAYRTKSRFAAASCSGTRNLKAIYASVRCVWEGHSTPIVKSQVFKEDWSDGGKPVRIIISFNAAAQTPAAACLDIDIFLPRW